MSIQTYPESQCSLTSSEDVMRYIYGGRGILTLEAPSGNSHTYRFVKPDDKGDFPDDIVFVYAVHEHGKYFYVGMVEHGRFRLTRQSRFLPDTEIVRGAEYIMKLATSNNLLKKTPMKLYHEGVCCRCGRKLTDANSIKIGIGPKCLKILNGE